MKQFIQKSITALVFIIIFNISSLSFVQAAVSTPSLVTLANTSRAESGLSALTTNSQLESAAQAKATDMLENQYFAHFSPSGKTPWDFIKSAGYTYTYAGENLAIGYSDSAELHDAWMNSPSHRENIMNPNYREIGMASVDGVYDGAKTTIVVQEFGSSTAVTPVVTEKVASDTPQLSPVNFEIIKDQTTYSPNKIFTGDKVTFKATVTGDFEEAYFTVGEEKITLDQTLEKKVAINQAGDLKVTLTAIDANKNQKTEEIGTLKVAEKVIMNANTQSNTGLTVGSVLSSIANILSNNLMIVSLTIIVLTLGIAGYFLFRQRKYGKFI